MKIQYFNGGLGNQLFQYIFYRYLEIHSKDIVWLDNMKMFRKHEHNGYELERIFNVKPNLISNYFEPDVWEYMVGLTDIGESDLCKQLTDMGLELTVIGENKPPLYTGKTNLVPNNQYLPELASFPGDIYYYGWWINRGYFLEIKDILLEELKFPPIVDKENKAILGTIDTQKTISLHIRRGDFVTLGWQLSEDFYCNAVTAMNTVIPNACNLIFSDDIPWCKAHYKDLGLDLVKDRIQFVDCNHGENSYIDMQLMSMCDGMILANSSFSYFASLYNQKEGVKILNPMEKRNNI